MPATRRRRLGDTPTHGTWKAGVVAIGLLALGSGVSEAAQTPGQPTAPPVSYAGRTLDEALAELRSRGLKIIYTSNVVRPVMRVVAEPTAATPRLLLDELLAAHGLEALDGPNDTIVVVPRVAAPEPPTAAAAGSTILGTVRSRRDATPIAGVSLRLLEADGATTSAADGSFLIAEVEAGTYTLGVGVVGDAVQDVDHRRLIDDQNMNTPTKSRPTPPLPPCGSPCCWTRHRSPRIPWW